MVYRWKSGARAPVSAQVAGEVCERLSSEGRLTASELVDVSRPEDAPLHNAFEWNDAKAAERYRETQASYIIRSVEVVVDEGKPPTRAFVSVKVEDERSEYQSAEVMLRTADGRETLLESAKRELAQFQRKYSDLKELADVFAAADRLMEVA